MNEIRTICDATGVVFIFDEVYTGFRLAPGGAQEYFNVQADMVCYGKTLGGGLPNGIVCGPSRLMNRSDPTKPLRVAYVYAGERGAWVGMGGGAEFDCFKLTDIGSAT